MTLRRNASAGAEHAQQGEKFPARYFLRTEAQHVRRGLLAVHHGHIPFPKPGNEMHHGGLGSIRPQMKHGFSEKGPAPQHAVQPPGQFPVT